MAELVTIPVVDPFAGRYVCAFSALVSGEADPVEVVSTVEVQPGYLELDATSLRAVCEEMGLAEHPVAYYAAEIARKVAGACQRPASGVAEATLDGGVVVRATYSG